MVVVGSLPRINTPTLETRELRKLRRQSDDWPSTEVCCQRAGEHVAGVDLQAGTVIRMLIAQLRRLDSTWQEPLYVRELRRRLDRELADARTWLYAGQPAHRDAAQREAAESHRQYWADWYQEHLMMPLTAIETVGDWGKPRARPARRAGWWERVRGWLGGNGQQAETAR